MGTIFCCHEFYSDEAVAIKDMKSNDQKKNSVSENSKGNSHPLSPTKKEWDFLDKEKDIEVI